MYEYDVTCQGRIIDLSIYYNATYFYLHARTTHSSAILLSLTTKLLKLICVVSEGKLHAGDYIVVWMKLLLERIS